MKDKQIDSRFTLHYLIMMDKVPHLLIIAFFLMLKVVISGLRQLVATECPLKMMKNAFYFTSKPLFVLKIFKPLS